MNLRDRVNPYITLHVKNMVLIIVKVHVGMRIFNRSLGHSCVSASAIMNCKGVFQVKEERTKHDHSMVAVCVKVLKYTLQRHSSLVDDRTGYEQASES
jgi:hypothetical protein